jgi:hypothetical protein
LGRTVPYGLRHALRLSGRTSGSAAKSAVAYGGRPSVGVWRPGLPACKPFGHATRTRSVWAGVSIWRSPDLGIWRSAQRDRRSSPEGGSVSQCSEASFPQSRASAVRGFPPLRRLALPGVRFRPASFATCCKSVWAGVSTSASR